MYDGRKIIGFIPARAGSKGVLGKNIHPLGGKPLIAYSIEAGLQSRYIDDVMVSTDGDSIAAIARECGAWVPFMQPVTLAQDTSKIIDVVLDVLPKLEAIGKAYDDIVLLQPTQPLRDSADIDAAIETYYQRGREPLASVSIVSDHPLLIRRIGEGGKLENLLDIASTCRRQDMPPYYRVNGCVYVNRVDGLSGQTSFNDNPIPHVMDPSHSVDIDDLSDFALAEYYLSIRRPSC